MPEINIGITVASPLLVLLSLVFNPQLGNNASISFIVSFGAFFLGSFIFPLISKHRATDIIRNRTYLGHLDISAEIELKQLLKTSHHQIYACYVVGTIAFAVGILFSVMNLCT